MNRVVAMNPALGMPYGGAQTGRLTLTDKTLKFGEHYGMGVSKLGDAYIALRKVYDASPEGRQKAARKYKCPTCGVEPGMYCEKVPDVPSRNRQRKPRRRHFVHDDRMLKVDLFGVPE